jgi:hypothetical protein
MKHAAVSGIAGVLAVAGSLALATYGAHDVAGLFAVMLAYPGAFAVWRLDPPHGGYWLVTGVNWIAYFAVLEAVLFIARLAKRPRKRPQS